MWRTLVATSLGTFVIATYHGDLSDFSVLSLGQENTESQKLAFDTFTQVPFYILVGAMGGLLGAFFNGCYMYFNTLRSKRYAGLSERNKNFARLSEVLFVSVLTSLVTFCLPVYLPESWACTDVSKLSREAAVKQAYSARYNCPEGQFNEIATIMLGSRDEALNDILTDPSNFEARTLLLSGLAFLFLMVITFGIFIPSGLFMPTLLTGSTLSGWAGLIIQRHFLPSLAPEHLALVGATATLAGVQRTTVSLCVIMMEATGQTKVLIPLLISVIVARYVGDLFNEGFYHVSAHSAHEVDLVPCQGC
jgi:chloride channel 7